MLGREGGDGLVQAASASRSAVSLDGPVSRPLAVAAVPNVWAGN